jgi:hypothetical protein
MEIPTPCSCETKYLVRIAKVYPPRQLRTNAIVITVAQPVCLPKLPDSQGIFERTVCEGTPLKVIMNLIQSAKLNGHDPSDYLKDVHARLPTQPARDIDDLLPHRWAPSS